MRCPKCGFISFDHLETCLKCKKNIAGESEKVQGTTFHAQSPSFLRIPKQEEEADDGFSTDGEFDAVDPDLSVLSGDGDSDFQLDDDDDDDDDDAGIAFDIDEDDGDDGTVSFDMDEDESEDETEMDLDQFEEMPEDDTVALDFSDELSDISDLAPPDPTEAKTEPIPEPPAPEPAVAPAGDMDLGGDFDLGGLDLDLGGGDPAGDTDDKVDFGELSLDDIDLSGAMGAAAKPEAKPAAVNDDLDLGDLDLGGLGGSDKKKKDSDPLGDLNLSLD